jgi:hypothetical protein
MKNSEYRKLLESSVEVMAKASIDVHSHDHSDCVLDRVVVELDYMIEIAQEALDERLDTKVTTSDGLAQLLDREGYTFTGDSQTDLATAREFMPRGIK